MLVRALVGLYYTMAHSLIRDHSLNHIYSIYYSSFMPSWAGGDKFEHKIQSNNHLENKSASYKVKFALII